MKLNPKQVGKFAGDRSFDNLKEVSLFINRKSLKDQLFSFFKSKESFPSQMARVSH
jgi:hypothetical protein